ncbi:hypothetical protein GALMADRAFT_1355469 [Galerina marginata CBS 339.88]|uniref:Uncharacterized protein n=1 Tax=Galerina marginata (strain CBS 339.88) TaxID=685588 RepID=A0A067SK08_GALM3|nr:hypothetical protein GALMADRAFT_1355469 [Galerina marginata CBS 339.88]
MFDAEALRNHCLAHAEYAASDGFLSLGKWRHLEGEGDVFVRAGSVNGIDCNPVSCALVGVVSADKALLEPHGNYYTRQPQRAHLVKLQFSLRGPKDHPDLYNDFQLAMRRIISLQNEAGVTTNNHKWLIFQDEQDPNEYFIRLTHYLMEPKSDETDTPARNQVTANYRVEQRYAAPFQEYFQDNVVKIMPVTTTSGQQVRYREFSRTLKGAIVLVVFELRHLYIAGNNADNFTGVISSVTIKKEPVRVRRGPSALVGVPGLHAGLNSVNANPPLSTIAQVASTNAVNANSALSSTAHVAPTATPDISQSHVTVHVPGGEAVPHPSVTQFEPSTPKASTEPSLPPTPDSLPATRSMAAPGTPKTPTRDVHDTEGQPSAQQSSSITPAAFSLSGFVNTLASSGSFAEGSSSSRDRFYGQGKREGSVGYHEESSAGK